MLLAVVSGAPPLFAVFVLAYGLRDVKNPLLSAYKNAQIASSSRATALSLMNMITSLYVALTSILLGGIADTSVQLALLVGGGLVITFTLLTRLDRLAGYAPPAPSAE